MRLAVPTETRTGERRVAIVPDAAKRLIADGWDVCVQAGAGQAASIPDDVFRAAGVVVARDAPATMDGADMVVRVHPPEPADAALLPEGALHLSFLQPHEAPDALRVLAERRGTVFSFDLLPRIGRAQSMDALSSQATVAGYRAGLVAADHLGRFFPMFMTAAGTVPPAKVLVMGVGVAGLQAIATARRLGAVVHAYDVREAAKEEAESLGAKFVDLGVRAEGVGGYARELSDEELFRQREALVAEVAASDVVITTAAVPGKRAPILVTTDMVDRMGPGTVIIDIAADAGGNCELTEAGREIVHGGVTIVGVANPASDLPNHASFLYGRNVANFCGLLSEQGSLRPHWSDELVVGSCVLREGRPVHGPTAEVLGLPLARFDESGTDEEPGT